MSTRLFAGLLAGAVMVPHAALSADANRDALRLPPIPYVETIPWLAGTAEPKANPYRGPQERGRRRVGNEWPHAREGGRDERGAVGRCRRGGGAAPASWNVQDAILTVADDRVLRLLGVREGSRCVHQYGA
jgi:hypothetical protein